jgi:hypothetical protein
MTTIKAEEPWVKHKVSLLINIGASIPAIPFSPEHRSSKIITVCWHIRPASRVFFHSAFNMLLGRFHCCYSFVIVSETPTPLLGRNLLSKLGYSSFYPQERNK